MEETLNEIPTDNDVGNPPPKPEIGATAAAAEETLELPTCEGVRGDVRAEIDTSAPFESVKEAVDRFGGSAVWKSQLKQLFSTKKQEEKENTEELEVSILEEQTAQLEKDLIIKERETLSVLKELESTKQIISNLKSKIQKEFQPESDPIPLPNPRKIHPINEEPESESDPISQNRKCPNILNELKQAKLNLNKTTQNLSSIRASIEFLNTSIEKEKILLDKTKEKLSENRAVVSSLENDLNFTTQKLKLLTEEKEKEKTHEEEKENSKEIKEMSLEMERIKMMTESARADVANLTAEIERTKNSINLTEIKFIAAKKIEEAAKESESIALTEIKALLSSHNLQTLDDGVTLSLDEYNILNSQARGTEEASRRKVEMAMFEIDEANRSKLESLEKLEKARIKAKQSRKLLEEALKRVETADELKIRVEESLKKLKSQKRLSHGSQSGEKFKKVAGRKEIYNYDYDCNYDCGHNRSGLESEDEGEPTLSIGQILSMKLTDPDLCEKRVERVDCNNNKVSLGQMLNRKYAILGKDDGNKENVVKKRKKLGFVGVGISVLLAKQQRIKKKRPSLG